MPPITCKVDKNYDTNLCYLRKILGGPARELINNRGHQKGHNYCYLRTHIGKMHLSLRRQNTKTTSIKIKCCRSVCISIRIVLNSTNNAKRVLCSVWLMYLPILAFMSTAFVLLYKYVNFDKFFIHINFTNILILYSFTSWNCLWGNFFPSYLTKLMNLDGLTISSMMSFSSELDNF